MTEVLIDENPSSHAAQAAAPAVLPLSPRREPPPKRVGAVPCGRAASALSYRHGPPLQASATVTPVTSERRIIVLIAEDDHLLRVLLATILRDEGYRVLQAADGIRAVRLLAEYDVDVLLLDVNLGRDDGVSLGREIRDQHPELPIALMSGDSSAPEAMVRARGFTQSFLAKPFTPERVSATIEVLARRRGLKPAP